VKKRARKERHLDWNIEPWATFAYRREIGPEDFRSMRQSVRLTQIQCGELLDVHHNTIKKWEAGRRPVPSMAYHVLRLLFHSGGAMLTHPSWDGWQVADDGRLYAPGGSYSFEADELAAWWIKSQQFRTLKADLAAVREALSATEAENTELRALFVNQGIVAEIAAMQERLAELVGRLNTAKVIPLPTAHPKKRAAQG